MAMKLTYPTNYGFEDLKPVPKVLTEGLKWTALAATAAVVSRSDVTPEFVGRVAKVSAVVGIARTGLGMSEWLQNHPDNYSRSLGEIVGEQARIAANFVIDQVGAVLPRDS